MTVTVTVANSVPAGSLGAAFSSFSASGLFTLTGVEDTLTAHAGGTQAAALALSSTKNYHRISVCATAGDSVALPAATVGQAHFVRNDGAASCQVYGTTPDTIDGVATATGVALPAGVGRWFVCTTAAKWYTDDAATTTGSGANVLANAPSFNTGIGVGAAAAGAGGIAFPAAAVAVADANTLDDYEEGTWTPSLGGDTTYNVQEGTYVKIGKLVHIRGVLNINVLGTGSASTISVGSLPFAPSANRHAGSISFFNSIVTASTWIGFFVDATGGYFEATTAASDSITDQTNVFKNGTIIHFAATYIAA